MDYLNHQLCKKAIPPIPHIDWDKVHDHEIKENGEELVPASLLPEKILARPQYFLMGLEHAMPECFVRQQVLKRLIKAASSLPKGFKLVLLDTFRPVDLQEVLFSKYMGELKKKNPKASQEELQDLTQRFVALPKENPNNPSPHSTGGAVDLTIAGPDGIFLDMGALFDETSDKSITAYFEQKLKSGGKLSDHEEICLKNRRLLYNAMTQAGFTNFPNEWWHFDFGNQLWGHLSSNGKTCPAIYGPAKLAFRWN